MFYFFFFLSQMSEAIYIPAMDSMNMIYHLACFVTRPMTNWAVIVGVSGGSIPVPSTGMHCAALAVKYDDFINKQLLLVFGAVMPLLVPVISQIFLLWANYTISWYRLLFRKVCVSVHESGMGLVEVIFWFCCTGPPLVFDL